MTIRRNGLGMLCGAALAACLSGAASAQDNELVGKWNCSGGAQDAELGMDMKIEFEQTLAADGTYERAGEVSVVIAAFQVDAQFTIEEAGRWRRNEMVITEVTSEIEIGSINAAPSEIEQLMLGQMQAEADADIAAGTETSSQITSLTATSMVLDEGDELVVNCQRA